MVPRDPVGRDAATDPAADAHDTNRMTAVVLCLISAETGQVESSQKQMSGNATQYKRAPLLE